MAGTRVRRELDALRSSKKVGRLQKVLNEDEAYDVPGWRAFLRDLKKSIRKAKKPATNKHEFAPPFSMIGFSNLRAVRAATDCHLALWEIVRLGRTDVINVCPQCSAYLFFRKSCTSSTCRVVVHRERERQRPVKQ